MRQWDDLTFSQVSTGVNELSPSLESNAKIAHERLFVIQLEAKIAQGLTEV